MTLKQQKRISAGLTGVVAFGGLEAIVYILNLNQTGTYFSTALWIYLYLLIHISLLFDLHFKNPGALARAKSRHENVSHWLKRFFKVLGSAFWDRIEHLRKWKYVGHLHNYFLLPGFIFWSTVTLFYLNFGRVAIQQALLVTSTIAFIVNYWYLKNIFHKKAEVVDNSAFVALSVVKIYTSFLLFSAALGIIRRFCLSPQFFVLAVFALVFLLVYQALFQHRYLSPQNTLWSLLIAGILGFVSYLVFLRWGLNYFTAGVFMSAVYNFIWSNFHNYLDKNFTWKSFFESLLLAVLIGSMMLAVTNFKARLLDAC